MKSVTLVLNEEQLDRVQKLANDYIEALAYSDEEEKDKDLLNEIDILIVKARKEQLWQ